MNVIVVYEDNVTVDGVYVGWALARAVVALPLSASLAHVDVLHEVKLSRADHRPLVA